MEKKKKREEKIVIKDLSKLKEANIMVEEIPKSKYLVEVDTDNFYTEQISNITQENRKAKAPYNFIPLNDKIIRSDFNTTDVPFNKYHTNNRFTGYIKVNIETKTPIYIRDSYNESQLDELKQLDSEIEEAKRNNDSNKVIELEKQKLWNYPDFFSPADGKFRIPGSSLRGLIRNMVEIVSYGKFTSFEDKRLYFRGLADQSNLKDEYAKYGLSVNRTYRMLCGILKKEDQRYILYETGTPSQISYNDAVTEIRNSGVTNFDRKKMKAYPISTKSYYIVVTGKMGGNPGKSHDWIVKFRDTNSTRIEVDERDVKDYKGDERRQENVIDLLKAANSPNGTPCFYTKRIETKNNQNITRIYFGHTGMFRVPYKKTIGEHIPHEMQDQNIIDIAEAIFGNENKFAGRVFFEDSFCEQDKNTQEIGADHPKILSGPKPTTFQHYLTQTSEDVRKLKHYNPIRDEDGSWKLSAIRGYKLYWHRTGNGWAENPQNITNENYKQYTKINPVKPETTFIGRIRFENLSEFELGALLFALDLPDDFCHKIGMGKPLGLGSIRITPTLHLSNRNERYKNLFEEWSSDLSESTSEGKTKQAFKDKFATSILNQLKNDKKEYTADELWGVGRLEELKIMLNYKTIPNDVKTEYMKIKPPPNEFRDRPILPKPSDVN